VVNADTTVQAFTASVEANDDGVVGVTYYDFRSDTADPDVLQIDFWFTNVGTGEEVRLTRARSTWTRPRWFAATSWVTTRG
jgi:hypothetical protein